MGLTAMDEQLAHDGARPTQIGGDGLHVFGRGACGEAERDAAIGLLDAPWMTDRRRAALRPLALGEQT